MVTFDILTSLEWANVNVQLLINDSFLQERVRYDDIAMIEAKEKTRSFYLNLLNKSITTTQVQCGQIQKDIFNEFPF